MGIVIPTGGGLAALHFTCTGIPDDMVTTFGYGAPTTDAANDSPDEHAETIRTTLANVTTGLLAANIMSDQYTFRGVKVIEEQGSGHIIGEAMWPVVGTVALPPVPPNCAFLVRKSSSVGGRRGRGRMYFPPLWAMESNVSAAGVISAGQLVNVQTRLTQLLVTLAAAGMHMKIFHFTEPGEAFLPGTPVTALTADYRLATQRRRLR